MIRLSFLFLFMACFQVYLCQEKDRTCNSGQDCMHGECCISYNNPRGKRAVGATEAIGYCKSIASEGENCYVDPLRPDIEGVYYYHCPCACGLTCAGNGVYLPPVGELGTCRPVERPCNTSSDCCWGECCVSNVRPVRKRSVDASGTSVGTCQPMGAYGADCLVNNGSGRVKDPVHLYCPCRGFLKCVGNGLFDIPLGELGRCEFRG